MLSIQEKLTELSESKTLENKPNTLSLLKLGMELVQKNFEFLIFRRGPVMEIFKIPNF